MKGALAMETFMEMYMVDFIIWLILQYFVVAWVRILSKSIDKYDPSWITKTSWIIMMIPFLGIGFAMAELMQFTFNDKEKVTIELRETGVYVLLNDATLRWIDSQAKRKATSRADIIREIVEINHDFKKHTSHISYSGTAEAVGYLYKKPVFKKIK